MRGILILGFLVIVMGFIGWISYDSSPTRSSINLETEKIEADVKQAKSSALDLIKADDSHSAIIDIDNVESVD